RLTPRFRETAKRLWLLYAALTVAVGLLLVVGEVDWYQALVHALTTMSTGGVGTEATSIVGFCVYSKSMISVFMFVAGASFALHFRALKDPSRYWRNAEFRLYTFLTISAIVVVAGGLLAEREFGSAVLDSAFNVVSIITTTGFATADFAAWRPAL